MVEEHVVPEHVPLSSREGQVSSSESRTRANGNKKPVARHLPPYRHHLTSTKALSELLITPLRVTPALH